MRGHGASLTHTYRNQHLTQMSVFMVKVDTFCTHKSSSWIQVYLWIKHRVEARKQTCSFPRVPWMAQLGFGPIAAPAFPWPRPVLCVLPWVLSHWQSGMCTSSHHGTQAESELWHLCLDLSFELVKQINHSTQSHCIYLPIKPFQAKSRWNDYLLHHQELRSAWCSGGPQKLDEIAWYSWPFVAEAGFSNCLQFSPPWYSSPVPW